MRSTASLVPRMTGFPANTVGSIAMRAFQLMAGLAYSKTMLACRQLSG